MSLNKIFNIGLPKTGTTSLNQALNDLGFPSIHNPKSFRRQAMKGQYHFDSDDWRALTNFGEHFYPQLDKAYPGSKFILTVRDEEAWLTSLQKQFGKSTGDEVGARWEWSRRIRTVLRKLKRLVSNQVIITHMHARIDIFGTYGFHRERNVYVYRLHRQNALDYFHDRPQDFILMDIAAGDGWGKLCPFLKIDTIPDVPFPHKCPTPGPHA